MNGLTAFSPTNYHKPCLIVFALDVSGSMAGIAIDELNKGLQEFYLEIYKDDEAAEKLEICLVTFGSEAKCIQEPAKVDNFKMPTLKADGTTKIVDGIKLAIKQVELRKEYYRKHSPQYSRPMIIIMTDGDPDEGQDVSGLKEIINNDMVAKKYTLHVLETSDSITKKLEQIFPKPMIYKLNGLNYRRFFKWLSNSIDGLSNGENPIQISGSSDIFTQRIID